MDTETAGELILDVKHGEVGGSDDLPCDPECEPEKGIHVLRSGPLPEPTETAP